MVQIPILVSVQADVPKITTRGMAALAGTSAQTAIRDVDEQVRQRHLEDNRERSKVLHDGTVSQDGAAADDQEDEVIDAEVVEDDHDGPDDETDPGWISFGR